MIKIGEVWPVEMGELLRQARLVKYEKQGKSSVYMLDDEHVWQIIRLGLSHVQEQETGGHNHE